MIHLQKIMDENPGPLEELLGGKEKVFGFFVGKMMRELKGKASPDAVREALVKEVEKRKNHVDRLQESKYYGNSK